MRTTKNTILLFVLALFCLNCSKENTDFERNLNFNVGWQFIKDSCQMDEIKDRDKAAWKDVDLPHDLSMENQEIQDSMHVGPFFNSGPKGGEMAFVSGGVAWYRKSFVIDRKDKKKQILLHFDGVQTECEVYINGKLLGENKNGYTPFYFNISEFLNPAGKENEIAVKVLNEEFSSRWFTGFGIYRDVELSVLNSVHVKPWGVFVTTPKISETKATVNLLLEFDGYSEKDETFKVQCKILSPINEVLTENKTDDLLFSETAHKTLQVEVPNPQLWSTESPNLYTAEISISQNGLVIDKYIQKFGIRSINFSAEKGFLLNGKPLLLKGACVHHDNGILGAAAFHRAEYRRVELLKKNGFNAIRTAHNPPSKIFLNACDELGMMVIDEAFDMWEVAKRKNDYAKHFPGWWKFDLESMILRDRNHPSIIMWSYGNEIRERARPRGLEIAAELVKTIKNSDNTRPVTQAINSFDWDNRDQSWADSPPAFALTDVGGYNYTMQHYGSDHEQFPKRVMYGSESYPMQAYEYWQEAVERPYVVGDFVWAGMDYLGESGIGIAKFVKEKTHLGHPRPWPWFNANCGDIDIIGGKKPQGIYRDVLWGESKIEMAVHKPIPEGMFEQMHRWGWPLEYQSWNWEGHQGKPIDINVYSSYPEIKLELNGKEIGREKIKEENKLTATFKVPYQQGILKATGIENNEEKESAIIQTSGKLARLQLVAEQETISADKQAIAFIRIQALDSEDIPLPMADNEIKVEVQGEGVLLAAGSGSPLIEGSFKDEVFNLYRGKGLAIVRSSGKTGEIKLNVSCFNIKQKISIQTK